MKKRFTNFTRAYVYWVFLFMIIFCFWVILHEASHSVICKAVGGNPLMQIFPNPSVNCENIVVDGLLMVSSTEYFLYVIIPYILALIFLLVISSNRSINVNWGYSLVIVILLDILWNYTAALFHETDFRDIVRVSIPFFILSVGITISGFLIGVSVLKKRWHEFKRNFINSVRR